MRQKLLFGSNTTNTTRQHDNEDFEKGESALCRNWCALYVRKSVPVWLQHCGAVVFLWLQSAIWILPLGAPVYYVQLTDSFPHSEPPCCLLIMTLIKTMWREIKSDVIALQGALFKGQLTGNNHSRWRTQHSVDKTTLTRSSVELKHTTRRIPTQTGVGSDSSGMALCLAFPSERFV